MKPSVILYCIMVAVLSLAGKTFAATSSYTTPNLSTGETYPIAWEFDAKTVVQAFPTADVGTKIHFWDGVNQAWSTCSWIPSPVNAWSQPSRTIHTGEGFYWENGPNNIVAITCSGTVLTNASVSRSFTSGKSYLIGTSFLQTYQHDFMECVFDDLNYARYTADNLGFPATNGDVAWVWSDITGTWWGGIRKSSGANCSAAPGGPYWEDYTTSCQWAWSSLISPEIELGKAVWYTPAANVTWTEYPSPTSCR